MKIKYLFLLGVMAFLSSCGNPKQTADEIAGDYYGILPCADCPGIYMELNLKDDYTYSVKSIYQESDVDTIKGSGNFEWKNDSIVVLSNVTGENRFIEQLKFSDGSLKILDKEGNENTSQLAEFYVLKTTKPQLEALRNIPEEKVTGSNFKATGNEPFWMVNITKDSIKFEPMDGEKISAALPVAVQTDSGKVYETESGNLKVTILKAKCQDNMSGELFSHQVLLTFKTTDMEEAETHRGCGEYLDLAVLPTKLEGAWALNKINQETVKNDSSYKNPTMEINVSEGEISGNGGCNGYSGKIKSIGADELSISRVISTKMACPGMTLETRYFKALTGESLQYKFDNNKLILFNKETTLVFGKMD